MGKWLDRLMHQSEAPASSETQPANVVTLTPDTPPPASEAAVMEAMERACLGLPILPREFRAAIDDDEAQWCATGRIPAKTVRAYARLFAEALARDPEHPVNDGKVTCWACARYRGKRCARRHTARADAWLWCEDYQETAQ